MYLTFTTKKHLELYLDLARPATIEPLQSHQAAFDPHYNGLWQRWSKSSLNLLRSLRRCDKSTDIDSFRRPSTPSLQVGHELSAPLPPSPPGGPLPHALALPPSCLPTPSPPFTFTPVNPPAVRPRPTVNIRAALAGFKRSQTAGIQNPVVKAKKAKIASAFMVDKASQDKVKIGLMDLPGGMCQILRYAKLSLTNTRNP